MQSSNQPDQITTISHRLPADPKTGKGIKLTMEINQEILDQIEEFEAVAATNPTSIQDFLIRLNELQKRKSTSKI